MPFYSIILVIKVVVFVESHDDHYMTLKELLCGPAKTDKLLQFSPSQGKKNVDITGRNTINCNEAPTPVMMDAHTTVHSTERLVS